MTNNRTSWQIDFFFFAVMTIALARPLPLWGLPILFPVFIHEFAHLLVLVLFRGKPETIRFSGFGIRVSGGSECLPRRQKFLVLAAGPAANFLSAILFAFFTYAQPELTTILCTPHLLLGLWNMMPLPPADGGQMLLLLLSPRMSYSLLRRLLFIMGFCILSALLGLCGLLLFNGTVPLIPLVCICYLTVCLFRI